MRPMHPSQVVDDGSGDIPRLVVVWCPDWPVTAAWRTGEVRADGAAPLAVIHANRVVAASRAARAEGVAVGQRRRAAQAACPSLVLVPHDPRRDALAFDEVLRALSALTPRLELTEPGTCTFAARGPARYHGGDEAVAARALALVAEVVGDGVTATDPPGVGVADGRFTAAVAARLASHQRTLVVVPRHGAAAFLAPRPVHLLDDADLVGLLVRLGVRTLGDLAGLPVAEVAARFGPTGLLAHRAASGLDERLPGSRPPPPEWSQQVELEPPVGEGGPVVFAAKALADRLCAGLAAEGLVATQVAVRIETEHGERTERSWHRATGLGASAVVERVRWQLDGWIQGPDGPTGGVTLVRLTPEEVVADTGRQLGFWGSATHLDERAARAVARLTALTGPEAVQVPEWKGGRSPSEVVVPVPALAVDLHDRDTRPAAPRPWPGQLPRPAPAVVYPRPLPADVRDADGRSVRVSGRGLVSAAPASLAVDGGPSRAVVAWAGPWPLEERWWDPVTRRRRARFQVVCDDGQAHVVVAEHQGWWVDATYG